MGRKYSIGSSFLTSSPSMTPTYLLFSIAPLTSSSLPPLFSWEVLQDLGSGHLPILLTVPFSPVFCPSKRLLFFNFRKTRCDDFAFYFNSHCSFEEEYSSLSLSPAAVLFTFLRLNAAKSSIPFGRIKRQHKAWCSAEV